MSDADAAAGPAGRLIEALAELRWRIAVAESCTGGEVIAALTAVPGASGFVWGGGVVYSESAKSALAGVDPETIRRHGVVSEEVADALARGIRERAGVEVGLGVTGWAGPDSHGPDPVGTVYLGVATPDSARVERHRFDGDRARVRRQAVRALLELARRRITEAT